MSSNSTQRKIGVVLSYISIIASTIVQILYTPVLIGKLGQNEYGIYSLVYSIIGYLTVLDLGFGNAIVVYTSKYRTNKMYDDEKRLHGMFKIIFSIISIFVFLLGFVLLLNVDNIFGNTMTLSEISKIKTMMMILIFNLFITFQFNIYSSIISAYEKFIVQKVLAILNTILKPILMLPLLFMGFKSIALCIVVTIVNIIILLTNYLYCRYKLNIRIKFSGFDKELFKKVLNYSIYVFLGTVISKVNWSVDQFILGATSGSKEISIYSIAATLNQLYISLSVAISGVFLPKMTKMVTKGADGHALTEELIRIGRLQCFIIFLMVSGFVLFGQYFIELWVGKDFLQSYYVTLILIIPLSFELIQNLGLSIMQAMNKFKFRSISQTIMAIFNVIISIYLAKRYGAIGSAIGTGIAILLCNVIIINIYYYKVIKLDIIKFWKIIIKQCFPLMIPICIILILKKCIIMSNLLSFLIFGSIYVITYALVSYLFSMNSYEKNLVHKVACKVLNRN